MREIIFRGKEKHTAKWVYGGFACKDDTTYAFAEDYERYPVDKKYYIVEDEMTDWGLPNRLACYEVMRETIGQYTGLTDKNGKKIFEGDILRYIDEDGESHYITVVFEECAFLIEDDGITDPDLLARYGCLGLEVFGNIHDNPGLLSERSST